MEARRKHLVLIGGIAGLVVIAVLATPICDFLFDSLRAKGHRHVFINETTDHRFDESIRISILAAFLRTGVQNAVIITDRIATSDIQTEANQLFHKLDLGRQSKGRAILYMYSPQNHVLKIEVGYGLEGVLPDGQVHFFEEAAKTFIYADHYQDFWAELINTLNIEIYEKEHGPTRHDSRDGGYDFSQFRFLSGGAGITANNFYATPEQLQAELNRTPTQQDSRFQPGTNLDAVLDKYLESLKLGIGDENLPLLHRESQFFRRLIPRTSYQLFRNSRMYSHAGLDRIFEDGPVAIAFFKQDAAVLPIVFLKENAQWFVQEALSWALFQRFEDSMRVFLKYPVRTQTRELNTYLEKNYAKPLFSLPDLNLRLLGGDVKGMEPLFYFYFRTYWLDRVALDLAKVADISHNGPMLALSIDTHMNLGQFSAMLAAMKDLKELHPEDRDNSANYEFYKKTLDFPDEEWVLKMRRSFW